MVEAVVPVPALAARVALLHGHAVRQRVVGGHVAATPAAVGVETGEGLAGRRAALQAAGVRVVAMVVSLVAAVRLGPANADLHSGRMGGALWAGALIGAGVHGTVCRSRLIGGMHGTVWDTFIGGMHGTVCRSVLIGGMHRTGVVH